MAKSETTGKKKKKGIVQRMMFGDDTKPDLTPERKAHDERGQPAFFYSAEKVLERSRRLFPNQLAHYVKIARNAERKYRNARNEYQILHQLVRKVGEHALRDSVGNDGIPETDISGVRYKARRDRFVKIEQYKYRRRRQCEQHCEQV